MFSKQTSFAGTALAIALGLVTATAALAQITPSDPYKAYSTVGITRGETLRVSVANINSISGVPPDPCNVQFGFVNAAGVLVKTTTANIPDGHAAFLTLTFSEASAAATNADSSTRLNFRPVLLAPPCRTVSTTEVFDAFFGRTHVFTLPAEASTTPPPAPDFGVVGVTTFDNLRLNVTNLGGSNGLPPDPCSVELGFIDAAGAMLKSVNGTIEPGHTASITINYREAAAATPSTNSPQRFNLRPLVTVPPGPCRVVANAELIDSTTGLTMLSMLPAVQSNLQPAVIGVIGQ
ncbi:MAG TPA: hypothetical protein VN736_05510 [Candidatus Limnocylindrales bacterium]|nr:hypothetical protein [Candidatus Limnocylindrales bacterium]